MRKKVPILPTIDPEKVQDIIEINQCLENLSKESLMYVKGCVNAFQVAEEIQRSAS